mgnify:CR=1 FL=1|jgi:hypothetical protein
MNPIFRWNRKKGSGTYLKYEEGEVVPVEPKQPHYPPFLDESDDEISVKEFKEISGRKQDSDQYGFWKRDSGGPDKGGTEHSGNAKPPRNPRGVGILMRLFWLAILGILVYYFIPIFQYFISEPPKWFEQTKTGMNKALKDVADATNKATDQAKNKTGEIIQKAGKTSENIANTGKEALKQPDPSNKTVSLSTDEWLKLLSESQNTKQQLVQEVKELTESLLDGKISLSRYRLEMRGITTNTQRQQEILARYMNANDTSVTDSTLKALADEYAQLENWTVALGAVRNDDIVPIYNQGAKEQNALTQAYSNAFCSMLSAFGRPYKIQNGAIVY